MSFQLSPVLVQAQAAAISARDKLVERVRQRFGGQRHYVPMRKSAEVERMRQEIGRRWVGWNTRELCNEFDITESWLRELHEQAQGRTRASR